MRLKINYLGAMLFILATSCSAFNQASDFTKQEIRTIEAADSTMRVLTIDDRADCLVLRAPSHDLSSEALQSSDYEDLARLMVATVTHPSQDGVGIAGPQVGLNRRVVAVQRFDKEPVLHAGRLDHPFEVYPNIRIVWASDSLAAGPEGCLSVPNRRGNVLRSTEIVIEYADMVYSTAPDPDSGERCTTSSDRHAPFSDRHAPFSDRHAPFSDRHAHFSDRHAPFSDRRATQLPDNQRLGLNRLRHLPHAIQSKSLNSNELDKTIPMTRDTVHGFTAVIFQHEIDHLKGVLYIDKLQ